jgi:predicted short-subunit dehydrogenase-like oxidoreductase (DUF2520 family)
MTRPARLAVGVVSAGRVGAVLGAALARAGHVVVAASGVSKASVRRAEELLPDVPLLPPDEVAARADLVATESLRPGQIVVHTSGAHGVDVLAPAAEIGVLPLALHPAMTFTGRAEDLHRVVACCVGVTAGEGDPAGWSVGEALVLEMGAEPVRVPEAVRPLYHAALTHGANHLATLVTECVDLLRNAGIEPAERVISPLLSAALDNALRHGDRALTGPVARGDVGTVRKHIGVLREASSEALPAYLALARRTAHRAADAGVLRADAVPEILSVLDEETER